MQNIENVLPRKEMYSFKILLFAEFLLMIGYITLKISLALFLSKNGYTLDKAYSISTAALALFSICAVIWGHQSKYMPSHKNMVMIGTFIIGIAFVLTSIPIKQLQLLGIALFVMGGSLYSININLLVNNHFSCTVSRQQGNQALQWVLNAGCIFGVISLSFVPIKISYQTLYMLSALFIFSSFLVLYFNHHNIVDKDELLEPTAKFKSSFLLNFLFMTVFVLWFLQDAEFTRFLTIFLFIVIIGYILWLVITENNKNYLNFVIILLLCSCTYWIAFTIFSNQFSIFLIDDVKSNYFGYVISPLTVLFFDPLSNVLFGWIIYTTYKKYRFNEKYMLMASLMLVSIAFGTLVYALSLTHVYAKINILWPIFCITLYGMAEFLLITTITAQISQFIANTNKRGFFIGTQRLCSAFCASIVYYLLRSTETTSNNLHISLQLNEHLYTYVMIISLCSLMGFYVLNKLHIIKL